MEDGVYRILGRRSVDILKTGGYKVSALEIEAALAEHPAIAECAVVGLHDPEWGQRIAAAVVLRPGAGPTLDALRTWAGERLAPYKLPTRLLPARRPPPKRPRQGGQARAAGALRRAGGTIGPGARRAQPARRRCAARRLRRAPFASMVAFDPMVTTDLVHPQAHSVLQAFRPVPRTGVIYVTTEAQARGYRAGDPEWANLGQGQPETGPLPGAPPRVEEVAIDPGDQEYAPIAGLPELREAVAALYNRLFRRGMPSQYSAENVAISGGGRASLTRAVAALGRINLGHFLPDYTAYEELLDIFRLVSPIPILLSREQQYRFTVADLRREVLGRGLGALLLSNPCNPMGKLVSGDELAEWVAVARETDCTLLLDEFYSHFVWRPGRRRDRAGGQRRPLRRGRRPRPGGDLRRPDQELALSGLAGDLDGGPPAGDRGGGQRRLVPRRRRLAPAAAGGGAADGPGPGDRRDPRHPRRLPTQAGADAAPRGRAGHASPTASPRAPSTPSSRCATSPSRSPTATPSSAPPSTPR